MRAVRWAGPASRQFAALDDFYRAHSPAAADRFGDSTLSATRFLLEHPHAGSPIERRGYRKWSVAGTPYVILYRVENRGIGVMRVFHARQDQRLP